MSAPNEIQLLNYPANAQLLELGDVSHVLGDKATATTHPELPTRKSERIDLPNLHWNMVASSLYHRKLPTAWLWYSQTRTATPWAWKNMGNSTFHDENVNIWPKTSQNRWWHNGYAKVELDFSDFNFMHYWSGGSFLPDAHSIFSERSWNWNLKRPNSTSACAIIDFGRF